MSSRSAWATCETLSEKQKQNSATSEPEEKKEKKAKGIEGKAERV